jgi:hypothetical protein
MCVCVCVCVCAYCNRFELVRLFRVIIDMSNEETNILNMDVIALVFVFVDSDGSNIYRQDHCVSSKKQDPKLVRVSECRVQIR